VGQQRPWVARHLINNILLQEGDAVLYKDLLIVIIIFAEALMCSKRPIKTSNQRNSSISRWSALKKYHFFFFFQIIIKQRAFRSSNSRRLM